MTIASSPTCRRCASAVQHTMKRFLARLSGSAVPVCVLLATIAFAAPANSQSPPPPTATPTSKPTPKPATTPAQAQMPPQQPEAPKGSVLFERDTTSTAPSAAPVPADATAGDPTAAERSAPFIVTYDLDARIAPSTSQLSMRARLTVRNDGAIPLARIPLQISSSLHWDSATLVTGQTRSPLPLSQHRFETDADHTGQASEAVLTLPTPVAPGQTVLLDTFYSGHILPSAARLERIGAPAADAARADWDAIAEDSTALRGFGNVLWYPVAAPPLFLGQAAQLFEAVGAAKLKAQGATARLRLVVDFAGAPPAIVYFCGRRHALKAAEDPADATLVNAPGVATVEFPDSPIGFRVMSLFILPGVEKRVAPFGDSPTSGELLAIESIGDSVDSAIPPVSAAAKAAALLLQDWLGPQPLSALTIVDHPGQPFEDGPLLIAPLRSLSGADAAPALTHSLTHAWVQTESPWMDEGLAQFFVLLWAERTGGREAATAQLSALLQPLTLAEPALEPGKPEPSEPKAQPLPSATSELYYRRKAAAVWWMLRAIVGDDPLKQALQAWRVRPAAPAKPVEDALSFEALLEKTSAKDLQWFFADWVFHDRGLPDLSIVDVTPRELPAAPGRSSGWLIAVTVHNDGGAVAEVPVVVRSGTYSTTQRIRVAGFASVTTRVLVEAPPTEVVVNDGTTPEQRSSVHTRAIVLHAASPTGR